ncbi:hypothetical protein WJX82_003986 [Trebouxia sp. C0006]
MPDGDAGGKGKSDIVCGARQPKPTVDPPPQAQRRGAWDIGREEPGYPRTQSERLKVFDSAQLDPNGESTNRD